MSDIISRHHFDPAEKTFTFERIQDVEPILESNKDKRGEYQQHDCAREVAEIPCVILEMWLNEEHAKGNTGLRLFTPEFNQLVKRKLADPDWAALRTDGKFNGLLGFGS